MVSPVLQPRAISRSLYLPVSAKWHAPERTSVQLLNVLNLLEYSVGHEFVDGDALSVGESSCLRARGTRQARRKDGRRLLASIHWARLLEQLRELAKKIARFWTNEYCLLDQLMTK